MNLSDLFCLKLLSKISGRERIYNFINYLSSSTIERREYRSLTLKRLDSQIDLTTFRIENNELLSRCIDEGGRETSL